MTENNGLVVGLGSVAVALLVATMFMIGGQTEVDQNALASKITADVLASIPAPEAVPTAAEIAALIPAPVTPEVPEVVIPEFKSDEKVQDLWDDLYATEIEELEDEAFALYLEEFEDDEYELLVEWLETQFTDFDELEDIDEEDCDLEVTMLGLEDDEDKEVEIVCEYDIKYTLKTGVAQKYKNTYFVTSTVFFEEGDYSDEELTFSFA